MNFLKRIKKKSLETKKQYAFFSALSITLLITVVWVTTLPARFADVVITNESEDQAEGVGSFVDVFKDAKDQVGNIIESIEEEPEDTSALGTLDSFGETSEDTADGVEAPGSDEPRTVLIELKETETDIDEGAENNTESESAE